MIDSIFERRIASRHRQLQCSQPYSWKSCSSLLAAVPVMHPFPVSDRLLNCWYGYMNRSMISRIRKKKLLYRTHSLNIQKKGTNLDKYEPFDKSQDQNEVNGKLGKPVMTVFNYSMGWLSWRKQPFSLCQRIELNWKLQTSWFKSLYAM